ncbi:MAG TPA: DUF4197 domain-containing protein [Chitinophagaceae bacterium]|nr:DUF4197 domain-containing protein [Chitinophagaceae bacterium]
MKKILILLPFIAFSFTGCETAKQILGTVGGISGIGTGGLSNTEIVSGLKEALRVGSDTTTKRLSLLNGFFGDDIIRILMPPEAQKVERTLRDLGFGKTIDKAVLSMNRAAEDASKFVGNILWNSIQQMTIQDAVGILRGGDFAATEYLKRTTTQQLMSAFRPVIDRSLNNVQATRYWSDVFSMYNKVSRNPVNTDLGAYVTEKALSGLFYHIGLQEQQIRRDPVKRVTEILRRVFGSNY